MVTQETKQMHRENVWKREPFAFVPDGFNFFKLDKEYSTNVKQNCILFIKIRSKKISLNINNLRNMKKIEHVFVI